MSLLRETSVKMTSASELLAMLEPLAQATCQLSQARVVEVDLYNPQHNQLTRGIVRWNDGATDTALCASLRRNPLAYEALQCRQTVARGTHHHPGYFTAGIAYVIALPIIQQLPKGVILLGYAEATPPEAQPCPSLALLADQAAMALERFRLYNDLERRNARLNNAYQELSELAKVKDQIIRNVSHELRTPLTFIKGYAELVAEGVLGPVNAEQAQSLHTVLHKTDEVIHLINEIISLQPLGSRELHRTSVPVVEVLEQMAALFQTRMLSAGVSLHLHPIDKDLKIYGDPEKIRQICYNILDNATKFSPHGGSIEIKARVLDSEVQLSFTDEGIGIPQDNLDKIFDLFYQVDSSSTRHFGGLGLGLAVVRRIVESHAGRIWVESEVGKGSTFHVRLPLYSPQRQRGVSE
jgi:signal transduction histidine kinase